MTGDNEALTTAAWYVQAREHAAQRVQLTAELLARAAADGQQIAELQAAVNTVSARRGSTLDQLNQLGLPYRAIGKHLGLSAARVGQIVAAARPAAGEGNDATQAHPDS